MRLSGSAHNIPLPRSGQTCCYDVAGAVIPCAGTGQDAEMRHGITWPIPRFSLQNNMACDHLTDLVWSRDANLANFPLNWQESLDFIAKLNREKHQGYQDWRLPNRNEMRSLMDYQTGRPALPADHPFENIFLGWYWTSTTAAINPAYAWYVHLEGARMFYGRKDQYYLLWPVRGAGNDLLTKTGQGQCYNAYGKKIPCPASGQDGEFKTGRAWPRQRYETREGMVIDRLTNIIWHHNANLAERTFSWQEALDFIKELNNNKELGLANWFLPNINILASLVDGSTHSPALPSNHPFINAQDTYWSSTNSLFATDWAWALYLNKGACGVGYKKDAKFHVWPAACLYR